MLLHLAACPISEGQYNDALWQAIGGQEGLTIAWRDAGHYDETGAEGLARVAGAAAGRGWWKQWAVNGPVVVTIPVPEHLSIALKSGNGSDRRATAF